MPMPPLQDLQEHILGLANMVASCSYLPNKDVVSQWESSVFPTTRNNRKVYQVFQNKDGVRGMYDDNTTPRWALLWAHGIPLVAHQKGWVTAHVWPVSNDINAYTHLANLMLVPECFGSLTDKEGPLTTFIRWHTWSCYAWKPEGVDEPKKPEHYDNICWQYFQQEEKSQAFVSRRVQSLDNERIRVLRPLMNRVAQV